MGSKQIHVVDPSPSTLLKLWIVGLAGLVVPTLVVKFWPDFTWVGRAERALNHSLREGQWQEPWQAIDQKNFSSAWIRCSSLQDAVQLDQRVDDGQPHTGKLVLSEGGLAWRGQ